MGRIKRVMDALLPDPVLRRRCEDLEERCRQLYEENEDLQERLALLHNVDGPPIDSKLHERLRIVTAAGRKLYELFRKEWVGAEQQLVVRTVLAILDEHGEE